MSPSNPAVQVVRSLEQKPFVIQQLGQVLVKLGEELVQQCARLSEHVASPSFLLRLVDFGSVHQFRHELLRWLTLGERMGGISLNLTLRKIAIRMSKKCQKLDIFSKECQKLSF